MTTGFHFRPAWAELGPREPECVCALIMALTHEWVTCEVCRAEREGDPEWQKAMDFYRNDRPAPEVLPERTGKCSTE